MSGFNLTLELYELCPLIYIICFPLSLFQIIIFPSKADTMSLPLGLNSTVSYPTPPRSYNLYLKL